MERELLLETVAFTTIMSNPYSRKKARVGWKRVSISRQSQSVCCSNPIEDMTFKQGRHSDVYHHLQAHQYFAQDDYRCMSGEVISYRI